MNSFSPPIVISSGSTNVRCLVKQFFSSEHIPQIAVNILIDSTLGSRLRIFLKPSLRWLPISAATTTIFPAIGHTFQQCHQKIVLRQCLKRFLSNFSDNRMEKQGTTTYLQRHIATIFRKLHPVSMCQLLK